MCGALCNAYTMQRLRYHSGLRVHFILLPSIMYILSIHHLGVKATYIASLTWLGPVPDAAINPSVFRHYANSDVVISKEKLKINI